MGQSVHVARRRGKIAGLCIALSLMVGIIAERAAATATGAQDSVRSFYATLLTTMKDGGMLGPAIDFPIAGTGTGQPALAGDHQTRRVGIEGLGNQGLADPWPIGVGGVDQDRPLIGDPPKQRDHCALVGWRPPDAASGDAHRAKAEPAHCGAATERQGRRRRDGSGVGWHIHREVGIRTPWLGLC